MRSARLAVRLRRRMTLPFSAGAVARDEFDDLEIGLSIAAASRCSGHSRAAYCGT